MIVDGAVAVTDGGGGAPVGFLRRVQGGAGQALPVVPHHVHGAGFGVLGHVEINCSLLRVSRGQQGRGLDTGAGIRERRPPQLRQGDGVRRHQAALGAVVYHAVINDRGTGDIPDIFMLHAIKAAELAGLRVQLHRAEPAAAGGEVQPVPAADQGGAHAAHILQFHHVQQFSGAPVPGEQDRRTSVGVSAVEDRVSHHNGRGPVGAGGEVLFVSRPGSGFDLILRRRVLILRRQAKEFRGSGIACGAVHIAVPVNEGRGALAAQRLADP